MKNSNEEEGAEEKGPEEEFLHQAVAIPEPTLVEPFEGEKETVQRHEQDGQVNHEVNILHEDDVLNLESAPQIDVCQEDDEKQRGADSHDAGGIETHQLGFIRVFRRADQDRKQHDDDHHQGNAVTYHDIEKISLDPHVEIELRYRCIGVPC